MPKTSTGVIRHLCPVEVDVTAVIDVFFWAKAVNNIKNVYRKLAVLVLINKVTGSEKRRTTKGMNVLTRDFGQG